MNYRREIDGLRAVAVLPVIFFHAGFKAFEGGFVGVDVFFVISGYLITTIILTDMNKDKFSIITFYERRARRILPALFFVMICCLPFAWLWLLPNHLERFSKSLTAISLFSSNILFWMESGYFDTASEMKPLIHTWSLAVEEQYYVIFPLFIIFLWKLRKRWIFGSLIFVAVCSLAGSQWGAYNKPSATFFLLPTRGWELAVGALVSFFFQYKHGYSEIIASRKKESEALGLLGLTFIGYSIFAFDKTTPFPSVYALIPTLGTALIIMFSTSKTFVGRLLSTNLMVGIGLISYSAYLWHQPLFVFARHRSLTEPSVSTLLILSSISILLAYLSWRFVEIPFRDKEMFSRKFIFSFAIIGSVIFASIGLAGNVKNGFVDRFPALAETIDFVHKSESSGIECESRLLENSSISSACIIGDNDKNASFIVFGDSHAMSLIKAISDISASKNMSGLNYTFSSCPPLILGNHDNKSKQHDSCFELRKDFFSSLNSSNLPKYVILLQRWTLMMERKRFNNLEGGQEHGDDYSFSNSFTSSLGYEDALEKDYTESVRRIIESGRKVVLVYPVPEMGWDVPEYLFKMSLFYGIIDKSAASTSYEVFKNRNYRTYKALDSIIESKNLVKVIPENMFCDKYVVGRCVSQLNGIPLYYDDDHLSYLGAKIVAQDIFDKTDNFK